MDYTDPATLQKLCGGLGCNVDSLATQIYLASLNKRRSYISAPSASWVDDYMEWLRSDDCCKIADDGKFCPAILAGKIRILYRCTFQFHYSNNVGRWLFYFLQLMTAPPVRRLSSMTVVCGLVTRRSMNIFPIFSLITRAQTVPKEAMPPTDRYYCFHVCVHVHIFEKMFLHRDWWLAAEGII